MYYVAICDDEEFTCSSIETVLLKHAKEKEIDMDIEVFCRGEDCMNYMKEGMCFDILFLDIELITVNGIDIAKYIREEMNNEATKIIYISSKQQYAMQLFKTRPMDFMIKPLREEDIIAEFIQAQKLLDRGRQLFEFSTKNNRYKIPLNHILYFASEGRKISLYCETKTYEFYGKMDEIVDKIKSEDFCRIHKSYYINTEFVKEYSYEQVRMKNEDILSISQVHRKAVRKELLKKKGKKEHAYRKCD